MTCEINIRLDLVNFKWEGRADQKCQDFNLIALLRAGLLI